MQPGCHLTLCPSGERKPLIRDASFVGGGNEAELPGGALSRCGVAIAGKKASGIAQTLGALLKIGSR
jgi:hypothetical protein